MTLVWPLLFSLLTGAVCVWSCWPRSPDLRWALPFMVCVSLLTGLSLNSCIAFATMALLPGHIGALIPVEVGLLAVAAGVFTFLRRRRHAGPVHVQPIGGSPSTMGRRASLAISLLLVVGLAWCLIESFESQRAVIELHPHGDYDAWQFWNLRARCIYREGGVDRRFFAPPLNTIGHPLFLPITIVRAWQWDGSDSPVISAQISILFGVLTPVTLFAGLYWLRSASAGALASILLLSAWHFPLHAASELADAPVALYMLAAVVLAAASLRQRDQAGGFLLLCGIMTGTAAWVKNEGLLFSVILVVCLSAGLMTSRSISQAIRSLLVNLVGLGSILLFVVWFKVFVASTGPATVSSVSEMWRMMGDVARHRTIWQVFKVAWAHTFDESVFPWVFAYGAAVWLAALFARCHPTRILRDGGLFAAAVGALLVAGYYAVFLVTPHDLYTLLCGTLFRLLLQLWPLVILSLFMCLPTLEDVMGRRPSGRPARTATPRADASNQMAFRSASSAR